MTIQERNSTIDDMRNEEEIARCKKDILYFIEKYVRIKTDDGIMPLNLTETQKKYLRKQITNSTYGKRKRRIN